jgi:serine/threonine protein kinase
MSTQQRHLGKYELQVRLGQGAMAEVWKAFDPQLQRFVALKILHANLQQDPEFVNRFEHEASVIASLHHPNIVQLHDFQVSRLSESNVTNAYMVMDYIEGQTLANYIAQTSQKGQFPAASEIVHLFNSLGLAIDYAHQHGLIHRDIKPANILLDQRNTTRSPMGEPILTDFGMVKLLGTSSGVLTGVWLGSPLYLSPEQAQGYPGNERSDVYALGVILYELCTGVLPFQGETAADILAQHISALPLSPARLNRTLPPAVSMVILRCLAKDPSARFTSASSLTVALARAWNLTSSDSLSFSSVPAGSTNEPTHYASNAWQSGRDSGTSSSLTPVAASAQQFARPGPSHHPVTPYPLANTPRSNNSTATSHGNNTHLPVNSAAPFRKTRKKHSRLFITLLVLLFLLLSSSLGALYWIVYHHTSANPTSLANQVVGQAFFVSTGQLNENTTQGLKNELQLNLSHIPDLPAGKSYCAWLLSDRNTSPAVSILLGTLSVNSGTVKYLYQGDHQQTNLLAAYSRLLITEEETNSVPGHPSTDQHTWRYYAELPQTPSRNRTQHLSALDHLRNLLFEGAELHLLGIHGGLNIQLLGHTEKVLEWADNARDAWPGDPASIHLQVVRILDYLDGVPLIHKEGDPGTSLSVNPLLKADVPSGTPFSVDKVLAGVPLVNIHTNDRLPSYIARTANELIRLKTSPGVTLEMQTIASNDSKALYGHVMNWLENVREDAKQLGMMTRAQVFQPSTQFILEDMAAQANYAVIGQFDPATGEVQPGVGQIYYDIQRLATFDLIPHILQK